jgi:NADH-quinone oxidoreductase subunit E
MSENIINHPVFKREGRRVEFSAHAMAKIEQLINRYPDEYQKSALIPLLHIAQEESGGYLTVDVMDYVAELLKIQPVEVYEVATFYSMFYLEKVGTYVLEVCRTGPCSIAGGEKIRQYLREILKINPGETTADGLFTLKEVECLGSCGTAPVMQVNTEFYEKLTPARVDHLLDELRASAGNDKPYDSTWAGQFS